MITYSTPQLGLAGHPSFAEINTDAYVRNPGAAAKISLGFTSIPADGETMTWSWGDQSVTFTFSSAPGDSAFELLNSGSNVASWIQFTLLDDLLGNLYIQNYFTLDYESGALVIEALESGKHLDLQITTSSNFEIINQVESPLDPDYASNLRLTGFLHFSTQTGQNPLDIPLVLLPVEGLARQDVSEFLSRELIPQGPVSLYPSGPVNVSDRLIEVNFELAEQFGDLSLNINKSQNSSHFYFLPGGLNEQDFKQEDLAAKLASENALLSHMPKYMEVSKQQPLFVNLINWQGSSATFKLKIHAVQWDGQTLTQEHTLLNSINQRNIYQVPLHYDYLLGLLGVSEQIMEFQLEFLLAASPDQSISPVFTLEVDHDLQEAETTLIFENSLGYFEAYRLTGQREELAEPRIEYMETQLIDSASLDGMSRGGRNYGGEYRRGYKINTGFRNPGQLRYFLDLLRSPDVRLVDQAGGQRPVVIEPSDYTVFQTHEDYLPQAEIRIYEPETNRYYSDGRYTS